MSELPEGWIEISLESLLSELETGGRPKGGVKGITDGLPSIGGEHLAYNGGFDFTNVRYVPKEFARAMTKGRIKKHDILVVKDGATTGKTSFVGEDFPFTEAFVNEHVFLLRTHNQIESKFVFNFLRSSEGQKRILENFQGSAQGGINRQFAPNVLIPLAPLNEQKRIVAKLDELLPKVEACKERLQKIPTILKRFRQSVLAAAVSGKLTEEWRAKNPIQKIASESSIEPQTDTPEKWSWVRLKDVCEIKGGVTKGRKLSGKKIIQIPYLRVANVQDGYLDLTEIKSIDGAEEDRTKYQLKYGDILFTEGGDRDKLGRGTIWRNEVSGCIHQNHIFRARPIDVAIVSPEFVSLITKSDFSKNYFFSNASQSVNLASLNMTMLGNLPIPLPSLTEQVEIVRLFHYACEHLRAIQERVSKSYSNVERTKDAILAKAFSGVLVSQDPSDEPASALLERIKQTTTESQNGNGNPKAKSVNRGWKGKDKLENVANPAKSVESMV